MAVPKDLLDLLACALCKTAVKADGDKLRCGNAECGLVYPVKDGDLPIMLIDEAERPCPKCGATRDWTDDLLKCPKCSTEFRYRRR
jgi:uncharacterized protein YbaR (Trm112 family)